MKKVLKVIGFSILTILVLLYIVFLFVLPNVIDLNQYKGELQRIVNEQSRLTLDFDNIKPITTPSLAVGFTADNVSVKLPDNSLLFSANNIKTAVSLPQILLFNLKFPFTIIEKPFLNAEILKNGEDYKIIKLIENVINDKKEITFGEKPKQEEVKGFDFSKLKIFVPNVILKNYKILITDTASKHYLDLHGDSFMFGYYNGERIKLKTNAELYSDENKNASININLNTFLPKSAPKLDSEDDPAEKVDFSFINPVTTYQNYDLKTNINAKLKINQDKNNQITSYGFINIDDLTMKIATVQIPSSYLKIKTQGTKLTLDSDLYTHENENLKIWGSLNNSGANLSIKTEQIKLKNLLDLAKAFADSMQIHNEFNQYKIEGVFTADCNFKTNFKKLFSQGYIKIQNGGISIKRLGKILSKMNINLILDDNLLNIENSEFFIGNSQVKIDGNIDGKSFADIKIKSKDTNLPLLFNAFAPKQLRNTYNLKSGNLSSDISLKGQLKEAKASSEIVLNDLDLSDKIKSFEVKNKSFNSSFNFDFKTQNLIGNINNDKLYLLFPKTSSKIEIPDFEAEIKDNNILLKQNIVKFNENSVLTYLGSVNNYNNPQNIDFHLNGNINSLDLIKFIGKEMKPFFNFKGEIPVNVDFTGDNNKQTLFMQILSDNENYFTPIDLKILQNSKTSIQTKVDFKPNRIKIKDTGLYKITSTVNEQGNEFIKTTKIIGANGTIEDNRINLLKLDIPKTLEGKIFIFPKSEFTIDDGILYLYGQTSSPLLRGSLSIQDISIPEILTKLSSINFNFKKDELIFNLNKIITQTSDMNIKGKLSLIPSKITNINDLQINSNNLKIEDLNNVSDKLAKYMPKSNNAKSSEPTDIAVNINNGNVNMKKIKTGNIELKNTKANLTLINNNLALEKITTDIFEGKTSGNVLVNLKTMITNVDVKGSGINTAKMLMDSANVSNSLTGIASYSAKLLINNNAKTQEEQMKGINGNIDFNINDGQFGPFGRLENLIIAENIRESQFFQTALGGIINSLATIDTTHFSELEGHLTLKDGICIINQITSNGNVMNLHIMGNFNILKNIADMKVRVKLTSIVSDMLGPLNAINPINLMNNAASLNVVTAKAFALFCETVTEEEMNVMPKFSNHYVDSSATKFQLGVRGDASKPLTLIKSFKWLATSAQIAQAKEFADSLVDEEQTSEQQNAKEAVVDVQNSQKENKTFKNKIKHIFSLKN